MTLPVRVCACMPVCVETVTHRGRGGFGAERDRDMFYRDTPGEQLKYGGPTFDDLASYRVLHNSVG